MTSPTTVDGLVSGLNTSQVISQLMQIAAQPQINLKNQVATDNGVISAYQSVNSKMAALQTAAEAFTPPSPLVPTNPTWQTVKATSSSTAVTATATTGAPAGTFAFSVTSLAAPQVTTVALPSSGVTTGNGITLTVGGSGVSFNPASDTPQGVADAINQQKLGVSAVVVNSAQGPILQLTGASGAANAFTIDGLSAPPTNVAQATDAQITVGDPNAGGYTVTSATNTINGVIPNVTLNVSALATNVSVTTSTDVGSIADKMQAMVDAVNGALSTISSQSAYNATSKSGGPLTGDFAVRELQSNLLSAVSNGMSGYGSFSQFGVSLSKDGTVSFDRNAFIAAYNANPSGVQNAVASGLASTFDTVAKSATDPLTGSVTTAIQGNQSAVKELNDQVADWDTRLSAKQLALQQQFSQLEVALGQMKNQSSWLASQIAGLPTGG